MSPARSRRSPTGPATLSPRCSRPDSRLDATATVRPGVGRTVAYLGVGSAVAAVPTTRAAGVIPAAAGAGAATRSTAAARATAGRRTAVVVSRVVGGRIVAAAGGAAVVVAYVVGGRVVAAAGGAAVVVAGVVGGGVVRPVPCRPAVVAGLRRRRTVARGRDDDLRRRRGVDGLDDGKGDAADCHQGGGAEGDGEHSCVTHLRTPRSLSDNRSLGQSWCGAPSDLGTTTSSRPYGRPSWSAERRFASRTWPCATSRSVSSSTSTCHSCWVRPRWRGGAVAVRVPSRVARMKFVVLATPTTLPSSPSHIAAAMLAADSTSEQ